ncbi:hypothetical protein Tsubulata_046063 [Turnera subulata]|uniref:Secreted protein n=1 Tax=Turnera subulata TaxID=218843 RepID=A0A9Q0JAM1_9ROSI|nr:hypothetical protein Tsubulata_046063 [Turnera subulata]
MPSLSPPAAPSFSTTILFLILTLPHQHTHADTVLSLLPSSSAAVLSLLPSFSAAVLSLLPLRERLKWCCRVEGVNHLQKCRHLLLHPRHRLVQGPTAPLPTRDDCCSVLSRIVVVVGF